MDAEEEAFWRGQVTTRLDSVERDVKNIIMTQEQIKRLMWGVLGCIFLIGALPAIVQFIQTVKGV
jgi:hypothetical protein